MNRLSLTMILAALSCFVIPASTLAQNKVMGVATCASSNCHGSVSPRTATNVLQNEYTTWYKHEAHSQAFAVLSNSDSKKIAQHLGIGDPQSAELCLKCHATYVPNASLRGPKFRLKDGVGCESCHGAAEKYLQPHTARTSTHAANVKLGMIDLVSMEERAKVCLECHQGTDNQYVDHRLIGAGHPRLTYELDTYGVLQPNHWEIDKDYVARKAPYNSARAWMAGQVERSSEMLATLLSPKRGKFGAMPELSAFYCYNCHHSLKEDQWKSRSYGGHPGELHLNRSSLVMVAQGLEALDAGLAKEYQGVLAGLHKAYSSGQGEGSLRQLKSLLDGKISSLVNSASFKESVASQLLRQLAGYCSDTAFPPYEVAEQCAMGFSALSAAIDPSGKKFQSKIDAVYDTLKDEEGFNPGAFTTAAKAMRGAL
ncbi:MAG: hypothetical protein KDD69_04315 [Bdellovibrionales bacterium]|nr:hypothetical protein [Bdellovibrionales bacterium]